MWASGYGKAEAYGHCIVEQLQLFGEVRDQPIAYLIRHIALSDIPGGGVYLASYELIYRYLLSFYHGR